LKDRLTDAESVPILALMPLLPSIGLRRRPVGVLLGCTVLAAIAGAPPAAGKDQLADGTATVGLGGGKRVSGSLVAKPGRVGLVRFDLRPLVSPLARATLRLYVRRGGRGLAVHPSARGPVLSSRSGRLRKGRSYEFDVTAAIRRSGGRHFFALTSGARRGIAFAAGKSVPPPLRPRLRLWLERPGQEAGDGRSEDARNQLLSALSSVTQSNGHRYGAVDSLGHPLDTLKIIQTGPASYLGVYHTLLNGTFTVMVATSSDLLNWHYQSVLAGNASQPTIAQLGAKGFVIAYEQGGPSGIGLRFRYYPSLKGILAGRYAREFKAPLTLSRAAQGTPNIYGFSLRDGIHNSQIRVGLHYYQNGVVDRQATGTLRDFSLWHAQREPFLDDRPRALGSRGHIGDRDHIIFDGYDFNVHETELIPGDWSSWRTYLYDFRARTAYWLRVKTHGGSFAFGNPTVTEVTAPNGKRALVMTQFLFLEGAAPGEAGQMIYYRYLN
jgi:hypothetical protein